MIKPQLKFLQDCQPLELIKINLAGVTDWAIVGSRISNSRLPILILSEDAYCLEASDQMSGIKDNLNKAVLSYDVDFAFAPDHHETCNVGEGPLFATPRVLVTTKDDLQRRSAKAALR